MRRVRERVLAKGFTAQQLEACLNEYADLDVSDRSVSTLLVDMLTFESRYGRQPLRGRGWCSSRLGWTTWTTMSSSFRPAACREMIWAFLDCRNRC
jgi:DNA replication licensing factor MCM7